MILKLFCLSCLLFICGIPMTYVVGSTYNRYHVRLIDRVVRWWMCVTWLGVLIFGALHIGLK